MTEMPAEVDPAVAEHVVQIRDRFGLSGMRSAIWMLQNEIKIAEEALRGLDDDATPPTG